MRKKNAIEDDNVWTEGEYGKAKRQRTQRGDSDDGYEDECPTTTQTQTRTTTNLETVQAEEAKALVRYALICEQRRVPIRSKDVMARSILLSSNFNAAIAEASRMLSHYFGMRLVPIDQSSRKGKAFIVVSDNEQNDISSAPVRFPDEFYASKGIIMTILCLVFLLNKTNEGRMWGICCRRNTHYRPLTDFSARLVEKLNTLVAKFLRPEDLQKYFDCSSLSELLMLMSNQRYLTKIRSQDSATLLASQAVSDASTEQDTNTTLEFKWGREPTQELPRSSLTSIICDVLRDETLEKKIQDVANAYGLYKS